MKVYQMLARKVDAYHNCEKANNTEWQDRHEKTIEDIIEDYLPYGSGFDGKTELDLAKSSSKKLVLYSSFHPINECGYYEDWIDFRVIITPNLSLDFDIEVIGKFCKKQDLKEYVAECFSQSLHEEYTGEE